MDGLLANNFFGWFTSFIRHNVRTRQSDDNKNACNVETPLSLTIGKNNEAADQNEDSQNVFLTNRGHFIKINTAKLNRTLKMDKAASSNDDNTIEEDIEEAISAEALSDVILPLSPTESGNELMKNRNLSHLDPAGGKSEEEFSINDDALSGGGIKKHFHPETNEEIEDTDETKKNETFSQTTENDASEIDETSPLCVRSLDLKSLVLNIDPRDCISLDTGVRVIQPRASDSDQNDSFERDHSLEEIMESNHSIEITLDDREINSFDARYEVDDESKISKILGGNNDSLQSEKILESTLNSENSRTLISETSRSVGEKNVKGAERSETDGDDISDFKNKILSCATNNAGAKGSGNTLIRDISFEQNEDQVIVTKRMERIDSDFSKETLDDITEESEKVSQCADNDNTSNDFDSIISLNMIQMLENKVNDQQEIVAGNDACLVSLKNQLDSAQRRELYAASNENRDSLRDLPPSGRESSSLATTTSTEYRTIIDDIVPKPFDFHEELIQRNQLIEELTDALKQSMKVREQLQTESDKLAEEVQQLHKQLAETNDQIKKSYWPRDQESSTAGQRLSEISIDLVSESDEDLERHFLTDNEEKMPISNRNSKERQLTEMTGGPSTFDNFEPDPFGISKQIEQFQKYLSPDEMRIFFMVQKKYDDFLSQEIERVKMKNDGEMKAAIEQLENEKCEKDLEINRLRHLLTSVKNGSTELDQLRKELETVHSLEMEKLRTYFEKKCADLEKHYSEEVFSQKSQRLSDDTSASDMSDQEVAQHDKAQSAVSKSNQIAKKRSLEQLIASPLHRQMTPTTLDCLENESEATIEELKRFYAAKVREMNVRYENHVTRLKEKLRRFESKYADDEFMKKSPIEHIGGGGDRPNFSFLHDASDASSPYLIIDQDEFGLNESQEIRQIAAEYERRLQEQVALAKADLTQELANQIQALLSETTTDDNHWPPELILLREKFTAKSQLEIAQLQIKHEDEMSRLKLEFEKQLNRKNKRNSTFDLTRDLDQIVSERDNLRELSSTFLYLIQELAKFLSISEDDFNSTIIQELLKHGLLGSQSDHNVSSGGDNEQCSGVLNISTQSNQELQEKLSKTLRVVPDVSGLLSLIEDPTLIDFVADSNREGEFKLKECVEKLRFEANALLVLSEKINRNREKTDEQSEKQDSCEEEDGLKAAPARSSKLNRANSFSDAVIRDENHLIGAQLLSLPADIGRIEICPAQHSGKEEIYESNVSSSEVNVTLNELQNRLVKSESERLKLGEELQNAIIKNKELGFELLGLRDQLKQLDLSQREDLSEGYGLSEIQSPPRLKRERNASTSFSQLQDKARNLLSTPTKNMSENTSVLLQLIEEFCREGDKVMESGKRDRDDLQAQIDAADKKLKDTRQFLDMQAADREAERDEFLKEIEKLKLQIRDKEKERCLFEIASKEFEQMEQQIRDLTQKVSEYESQKDKLEIELKASIDKIFVLREIITDLETQVDTRTLNENCLDKKVKELEAFIASQARSNDALHREVESLKTEIGQGYQERINQLEEQVRNTRSNSEQNIAIEQLAEQLRDIETTLDQKTKTLETLHAACSNSLSDNYSEDVSVQNLPKDNLTPQASPINTPRHHSLPVDEVQRVFQKLSKHTRVEEAAIKKIKELEVQVSSIRTSYRELESERKLLQEKMSEQVLRISSLQSKLDEQRRRAEELNRQGTSDFAARIHDLQTEAYNLKETLSAREKQIANLKNHLEQSKKIIERQEAELAVTIQGDTGRVDSLEAELRTKIEEIQMLKDKMKKEMINKLALPDLMETMLADKNEEIDNLKEQVQKLENELQGILNIDLEKRESNSQVKDRSHEQGDGSKGSGRTLSDVVSISEFDEPDVIRRAITAAETQVDLPKMSFPDKTMDSSKCAANRTERATGDTTMFDIAGPSHPMRTFDQPNFFLVTSTSPKVANNTTPSLIPRQINFSEFADDTKIKESTPRVIEITSNEGQEIENLRKLLKSTEEKAESLKISLEAVENEKDAEICRLKVELESKIQINNDLMKESSVLRHKIKSTAKLQEELQIKTNSLENLHGQVNEYKSQISELELLLKQREIEITDMEAKLTNTPDSIDKIRDMEHQIGVLNNQVKQKDDLLSNLQNTVLDLRQNEILQTERLTRLEKDKTGIQTELDIIREELSEKVLLYQKTLLDLESFSTKYDQLQRELVVNEQKLIEAHSLIKDVDEVCEFRKKIKELEEKNSILESELDRLRSQNGDSKPFSLDEIAEKVEKELNYSAQLDTNILKAIESEEENNLNSNSKADTNRLAHNNLISELDFLKVQLDIERKNAAQLVEQLNDVRTQTQDIQQQDADIIEAMRLRLEEAIEKETELHKILDEEREKCERLSSQVAVLQRTEARKSSFINKTPPDSPRKQAKAAEEAEALERLKEEIKLVTSQNQRERERVKDLENVLDREKCRFEKELNDRIDYGEKLKREMDKLKHEKDLADEEVDHLQERLTSATKEIECLETRISTLQEAETRRVYRRGKERAENTQQTIEIQDLRNKIVQSESERDHLNEVIKLLRDDVDRGAQREAKLAEALANSGSDNSIPEQFMQKLKEMNNLLNENAKENRLMSEKLQFLTANKKLRSVGVPANALTEMEERANHLFGKYLRVESHRKALVHQKRYLMIILHTYQENETKALNLLNGGGVRRKKRRSFKCVALIVIAIERMKFIVRRWHTGRIVVSKSIFNANSQRHSASNILASGNGNSVAPRSGKHILTSLSPPCRDRPQNERATGIINLPIRAPLQAPSLIFEYSDKFDWTNR